jgi:hypothetical protein
VTTRKFALAIPLLVCASSACGQFYTGQQLKENIESKSNSQGLGYIAGVFDVYTRMSVCPPSGITLGQAADVVQQYLNAHPQSLHVTADALVYTALKDTWPCAKPEKTQPKPPPPKPKSRTKSKPPASSQS